MPIYTYRCKNCGVQFDKQMKFEDQPLAWCPECSKKTLYKVYQPVGIVFKGSGFYATDHRSPSGASRYSKEKSEESGEKSAEKKVAKEKTSEGSSTKAGVKSPED